MRKMNYKTSISLFSSLAFLIVAGCNSSANFHDGDAMKRNAVEMVRLPFMIDFAQNNSDLSASEIDRLDRFLMKSQISYGDEISMDFPLQRDGSLSEQNKKRLTSLTALMKKRGLHLSQQVTPYGMSPPADQARFLISRYVVTPPTCGDWSQTSSSLYGNTNMQNFGCTTQANLGLMIANPRDLVTGISNNTPNAEKAAKAVFTYRTKTGKPGKSGKSGKSGTGNSSAKK